MTDLRDNPSAATAAAAGTGPDPLHNLYRMSRTAGLGSGEYVAINNTSVFAFLMGLASVLALLNAFLLVFCVVAIVLGGIALLQIRSSNGTQTGQAFAVVGILLALIFGGTTGGKVAMARAERQKSEADVAQVIAQLGQRLAKQEYAQAYGTLFSEKFREDFSAETFTTRWETITRQAGAVQSVTWLGRSHIEPPRAAGDRRAQTKAEFRFEKVPQASPLTVTLVQQEGEWVIETIGEVFNADAERRTQQQRTPPQSMMQGPRLPTGP